MVASESAPPETVVQTLAVARGILERYRSLSALPSAWDIKGSKWPTWHFRLAACRFLLGDEDGFEMALGAGAREDCRVEDAVCEQFKRFETAIRARWNER